MNKVHTAHNHATRLSQNAAAARVRNLSIERVVAKAISLIRRPGTVLAWSVIILILVAVAAPQIFTDYDPLRGLAAQRLRPPSAMHWLGTDQMGRDLFARVVYGARESVKAVIVAVSIGLVTGSAIGLVAGFAGRVVDEVSMRLIDVMLAVPTLLIALAIINALGFGTTNIAIAVGIGSVASFARVMRSEVMRIRNMLYVEAARFSGRSTPQIVLAHVLPNASGAVFTLAAMEVGFALLNVSALSFLGFGARPPTPEWGLLVAGGRDFMRSAWWLITAPGLVIVITVIASNHIARSLRARHKESF